MSQDPPLTPELRLQLIPTVGGPRPGGFQGIVKRESQRHWRNPLQREIQFPALVMLIQQIIKRAEIHGRLVITGMQHPVAVGRVGGSDDCFRVI